MIRALPALPCCTAAPVWMLAAGQTLGYAGLYYSYGALVSTIATDTGWSLTAMSLGLVLALLIEAFATPFTGRFVDRGHGPELLALGPVLGAAGLFFLSQTGTLSGWYAGWALLGLAGSATFYETCFAWLTHELRADARHAITRVTLVAGFASTLAFPFGAWAAAEWGWRGALIAFGLLQLGLTAPLNFFAATRVRRLGHAAAQTSPRPPAPKGALWRAMGERDFWLIAAAFALVYLNHTALVTYFLPVFADLGATPAVAVAAAACLGPAQVAGRIVLTMRGGTAGPLTSVRLAVAGVFAASLVLLAAGAAPSLIFAFAVMQGANYGTLSILRPVLVADRLGHDGFGAISGTVAIAPLAAAALAPFVGALVFGAGGSTGLIVLGLVAAGGAVALLFAIGERR